MKKLVAVVAAVLVLAGCSAAPSDDGADSARVVPDAAESAAPEETTGPAEPELTEAEALFVEWMHGESVPYLAPGRTDKELLAAGWAACDQFAQGVPWGDIEIIDADADNQADYEISGMASQSLCTDYNVTVID